MSPIGIGIGIAITKMGDNETAYYLSVAVLQALAGGTLLYVVAFEVLERERSKSVSGLVQLFFVMLGFSVMTTVELLGTYYTNIKIYSVNHFKKNVAFSIMCIPPNCALLTKYETI